MILSDQTIKKYLRDNIIKIIPEVKDEDIKSIGIRLHLGDNFLKPVVGKTVDFKSNVSALYENLKIDSDITLESGEFILGTTQERFQVPRSIVGYLDGRSTLARFGLSIHITSQFADGNYDNASAITLEIKNNGPFKIILTPGMAIGMLTFFELSEPVSEDAKFLYKNQIDVRAPEL